MIQVLLLLFFVLAMALPVTATTYYVDDTGGDDARSKAVASNPATPWAHPGRCFKAGDAIAAGDTCSVNDGSYGPNTTYASLAYTINTSNGQNGSASQPITLKSTNPLGATIRIPNTVGGSTNAGIYINKSWYIVDGFNIDGSSSTYSAALNTSLGGIYLDGATNFEIRNNKIHDIARTMCSPAEQGHSGIYIENNGGRIHHNLIYTVGRLRLNESGCAIDKYQDDHGMYVHGSTNLTIDHNICYDANRGYCIQFYNAPQTNAVVIFNTFSGYNASATRTNFPLGQIVVYSPMNGLIIRNNIFHDCTGAYNCIDARNATLQSGGAGVTIDDNLTNWTGAILYPTHPGFVTESNSTLNTSPGFVNSGSRNYSLASGSAAIDTGTVVAGYAYNGALPDRGAYESFLAASASIDTNVMDITLSMNLNAPILPAAGITGFTVACSGHASCPGSPTVSSASRKSGTDSVIRLTISGITADTCDSAQTWTWSYTPGTLTDTAFPSGATSNQSMFAASTQAVTAVCAGSGTPPPAGPFIIYEFEDGAGTNANDTSAGGASDGTLSGATFTATGHTGGGVSMSAITHDVAIPYGSGVNPSSQSLTIAFGVLVDSSITDAARTYFGSTLGTNQRFYISTYGGTWRIGIQSSSDGTAGSIAVTSGWHRLCLVADSGSDIATLYVDGVASTGGGAKALTSYRLASNFSLGSPFNDDTPTATFDEFKLWQSAENCATDFSSWEQVAPAPTGAFEQKTHKWQRLRKTSLDAAEDYTAAGVTNGITITVIPGAAVALVTQIDCTVANCDPTGARLYYSKNGGAFQQVPDVCTSDGVCFYGVTVDSDVVSGTVECCLSGALTENDGPTNTTASAVPVFDLAQNGSFVRRSVIKFSTAVAPGDTFAFKEYHQTDLALNTYTPSGGAALVIGSYAAGF
jgi:hypothetical protein